MLCLQSLSLPPAAAPAPLYIHTLTLTRKREAALESSKENTSKLKMHHDTWCHCIKITDASQCLMSQVLQQMSRHQLHKSSPDKKNHHQFSLQLFFFFCLQHRVDTEKQMPPSLFSAVPAALLPGPKQQRDAARCSSGVEQGTEALVSEPRMTAGRGNHMQCWELVAFLTTAEETTQSWEITHLYQYIHLLLTVSTD